MNIVSSKLCSKCGETKPLSDFSGNGKNNYCRACMKVYDRARRSTPEQKEKDRLYSLSYRARPSYQEDQKRRREAYRANPENKKREAEYNRNYKMNLYYGISFEEYQRMYQEQNGNCAICGKHFEMKGGTKLETLYVDHDHETGKVRGLLCHKCNGAIASFDEDMNVFQRAIRYLFGGK